MKKHNGHSNGHVQSKSAHASNGLQATLAKKIAHKLAQTAGQQAAGHGVGRPGVGNRRVDLDTALAKTKMSQILATYTAIRPGNYASDLNAVAGDSATALGANANANSQSAVAVGGNTVASYNGVAIGTLTQATGTYSTAVGLQSKSAGDDSTALGSRAQAVGKNSVAVGYHASSTGASAIGMGVSANAAGDSSVAVGDNTVALNYDVAIGSMAQALGPSNAPSTAVGRATYAGAYAVAIGGYANASGGAAVALGNGSSVTGDRATGLGQEANAVGNDTIAIGYRAKSNTGTKTDGAGNIAIGSSALINNTSAGAIAIGNGAQVTAGGQSIAFGANALADEDGTLSIGKKSSGSRLRIVNMSAGLTTYEAVNVGQLQPVITALGGGASIDPATGVVKGPTYTLANGGTQTTLNGALNALDKAVSDAAGGAHDKYLAFKSGTSADDLDAQAGNSATAVGANANASAQSAVAVGGNSVAGYNGIAIGTLSQGTGRDSSAVGLQSLANGQSASAFGAFAVATAVSTTVVGNRASASGTASTVIGQAASGAGVYSVVAGIQANAIGSNTVVIGAGAISNKGTANTDGDGNIVIGSNALVDNIGAGAIVIGRNAKVNNNGGDASVTGAGSIAIGDGAAAYGNNSTAIGRGAVTSYGGGVALGDNAKVLTGTASVALGEGTLADADMTVSVGNKSTGLRHRIVNMDAGRETFDAINVNQLQPVVNALGGNASIDPDTGEVTGPTYTLANGGTQTTLSGALRALDQAVSNAGGENDKYFAINGTGADAVASGNNAMSLGTGANAAGDNSVAVGANSRADDPNTFSVGAPRSERKIVNVAQGDISVTSTDAITGAQLYATNLDIDAANQAIANLSNALSNGGVLDPSGNSLAVTYSSASKDKVQLGNAGRAVEITNVAASTTSTSAVNYAQLTDAIDGLRSEVSDDIKYVMVNSTDADANASGSDSVAIGPAAIASSDDAIALGTRARASADQSAAIGSDSLAARDKTVSVGNKPNGLKRRVVNMDAGTDDDDAVSVSQLKPVLAALGGNASVDPTTGAVTGPTYTFADGTVHTSLEDALGALDEAVSDGGASNPHLAVNSSGADAVANGNNAIALGGGATAAGNNSVALGENAQADQPNTVSVGKPGAERKIANVAPGDISDTSTDAVNGAQLDATNQQIATLENAVIGSGLIDPVSGTSLAVTYVNASKNIVSLGNLGAPVEIMNVADGIANSDAATVGQVTSAVDGLRTEVGNNLKYVKVNATGINAVANGADSVAIGSSASATSARGGCDWHRRACFGRGSRFVRCRGDWRKFHRQVGRYRLGRRPR